MQAVNLYKSVLKKKVYFSNQRNTAIVEHLFYYKLNTASSFIINKHYGAEQS